MEITDSANGYVIQLYQVAIRYEYNNDVLKEYFNECIEDKTYNSSDDEDYITLGYFDFVEINTITSFRQYHDVSKFAKRWVGKRQCMLLYDISNEECPSRLYYDKEKLHYWLSNYPKYNDTGDRRFFCLSMLSLTNDTLAVTNDCNKLLHDIRQKILCIMDDINDNVEDVDIACEVYGTFNTSEIAVVSLSNQYSDILLALEYIKHLALIDDQGKTKNMVMTTFSVISMRSNLSISELSDVRGDALLQLSFNDEQYSYKEIENVKQEVLDNCVDYKGDGVKGFSSAGEYDWEVLCSAKSILELILPYNEKSDVLQFGVRDRSKGGIYVDKKIRSILRNNTRLLIGSGENKKLRDRLEKLLDNGEYTIGTEKYSKTGLIPLNNNCNNLLRENRKLYFDHGGIRDKIKSIINASTGTVDTLDLLVTDYQSIISTAYSKIWVEDIHTQFNGVLKSIQRLIDTEKTSSNRFWDSYRDLTNAFKQQVYHLTQSSRMFFETPSSHLRATGQYDFLMHAYYGITKKIIEAIYYLQEFDAQSELIPLITVNTEPQVKSELFYEYQKDDARIINLIIPNTVITDPYRGIFYLCHELNHYSVPDNRVQRNYRLGVFFLCRVLRDQILLTLRRILYENCPEGLSDIVEELLDFDEKLPKQIFLFPVDTTVESFDYKLMNCLFSEDYYKYVDDYANQYPDCQGGNDALKSAYLKMLDSFINTEKSDELFVKLFKELYEHIVYCFKFFCKTNKNLTGEDKYKEGFKWLESRFVYYDAVRSGDERNIILLEKAKHYRKLERTRVALAMSTGVTGVSKAVSLCKAIDEARSDIASITLTGYSLINYIIFFIKNVCDLQRENDPDKIKLAEGQKLRFSLVLYYCIMENVDPCFCCKGLASKQSNPLIQGGDKKYFIKMLPWVFLGNKSGFADEKSGFIDKAIIIQDYAVKWIQMLEEFNTYYLEDMVKYYNDVFKPILDTTNVLKRYDVFIRNGDERATGVWEIRTLFSTTIVEYEKFRSNLPELTDLNETIYKEYLNTRFKLDLSIVQKFQNQRSLYQLNQINEDRIKNQKRDEILRKIDYLDTRGFSKNNKITQNTCYRRYERRFLIYSWNELQYYLKYCRKEFDNQLDSLGYGGNMYSPIWYRGQTTIDEKNYKLWPLTYRAFHPYISGKEKPEELASKMAKRTTYKSYCRFQRSQFEYFKTLSDGAQEAPAYGSLTKCDYVALMQHYCLETNLLDFTDNAFISLYIALKYFSSEEKAEEKQRDVAIYLFNPVIYNLFREKKMREDIKQIYGNEAYRYERIYGVEGENNLQGPIPNISILRNEKLYERYIFGSDELDNELANIEQKVNALPVAVWTPRINNRIRTQSGSFVAFDLYADINDENCHLMKLQDEEIRTSKEPYIFLYRIGVAKECCPHIYDTLNTMGMNRQFVYPELDKTLNRFK